VSGNLAIDDPPFLTNLRGNSAILSQSHSSSPNKTTTITITITIGQGKDPIIQKKRF
jgi:hypothetical protein